MEDPCAVARILIAGTHSGVGKTTFSIGIMAALQARGLDIRPYKVGPDYIDPSHHSAASGRLCRNLDSWMLPPSALVEIFCRSARGADIAVIEGVMGLFDGLSGLDDSGSTAEVARILRTPVILVIDAGSMARSAAAVAQGYARFDPTLPLAGFLINGIGSERHFAWVREAIETAVSLPVLGYLPKRAEITIPERHLGLIPAAEAGGKTPIEALRREIEETVDLDRIVAIGRTAEPLTPPSGGEGLFPAEPFPPAAIIAYARDEAFSFYYPDNLDLIEAYGGELVPFSPLAEPALPSGTRGIYIGGGFPEIYAERLSANRPLIRSIRSAAAAGIPIYAECGGLMYLSEGITDRSGRFHPMVGIVPGRVRMTGGLSRMGYVEVALAHDGPLGPAGLRARGHEFHWSETEGDLSPPAHRVIFPEDREEGYAFGNVIASYIHLHFGSNPALARNLVSACLKRI